MNACACEPFAAFLFVYGAPSVLAGGNHDCHGPPAVEGKWNWGNRLMLMFSLPRKIIVRWINYFRDEFAASRSGCG